MAERILDWLMVSLLIVGVTLTFMSVYQTRQIGQIPVRETPACACACEAAP